MVIIDPLLVVRCWGVLRDVFQTGAICMHAYSIRRMAGLNAGRGLFCNCLLWRDRFAIGTDISWHWHSVEINFNIIFHIF